MQITRHVQIPKSVAKNIHTDLSDSNVNEPYAAVTKRRAIRINIRSKTETDVLLFNFILIYKKPNTSEWHKNKY